MDNFLLFLWCTRYSLEHLRMNMNFQEILTHHFTLQLLFWIYCIRIIGSHLSRCNEEKSIEGEHSYLSLFIFFKFNLSKVITDLCGSSFLCLSLDNNCLFWFLLYAKLNGHYSYHRINFLLQVIVNIFR